MGATDEFKGRVKEAAGDLTDDKDLEREGKADRAAGKVKDKVDDVKGKAQDAADRAREFVDDAADKAREKLNRD